MRKLTNAETFPIMFAAGLWPLEDYTNGRTHWRSECMGCGREVTPKYQDIRQYGGGCQDCGYAQYSYSRRLTNAETFPIMFAAGLWPLVDYPLSKTEWLCECMGCGREVTPKYEDVVAGYGECPGCVDSRVDPLQRGVVYLIEFPGLGATKIGRTTTDARNDRIRQHERNGGTVVRKWIVASARDAKRIERDVLDHWRDDLEAVEGCTAADLPQFGHTETAPTVWPGVDGTAERVDALVAV